MYTYKEINNSHYRIYYSKRYIGDFIVSKDRVWEFHTLNKVSGMAHTISSLLGLLEILKEIRAKYPIYDEVS